MADLDAAYRKPNNFDDRLSEVKRKIAHLNIKAQNIAKAMHVGFQQNNSALVYQDDR